ncbi:acyltransferase [Mangrovimicrobium sediminis]|uniref:Acyltransferase n=1 Tax=Mangrovimicrobium sediminis TaxID=2562682 RepID=A0A4Z0M3M6_9GAMM|nr:acyltransferase family protein [Haliea sp. SAOS-164]TGD74047.1 acyltransferase [Haliea sp. SAOS-164]
MNGAREKHALLLDIQGLRAIAVTLVVVAHAGVAGVQGGFVGVDIFFVLSGYLITGLLISELERDGRVRLASFYARRLKRLLPALLVMIVGSCVAALYLLSGDQAYALTRSMLFAVTWTSNLFFTFRHIDYFDDQQNSDLFLHTWSLGVEEQFYLLWPLLLLVGHLIAQRAGSEREKTHYIFWMLVAGGLASWALSLWLTFSHPMAAYYQMPARGWQFALGACTWLAARHLGGGHLSAWTDASRRAAVTAGLVLICASAILIHRDQPYPGFWALLPSCGTALVLLCVAPGRSHRVLSHPVLVWLGDRSYSWYLWHWPVLMIGEALNLSHSPVAIALQIAFSLSLASVSYALVEYPFWRGRLSRFQPGRVIGASLAAMLLAANICMLTLAQSTSKPGFDQAQRIRLAEADLPVIYRQGCDTWYESADLTPCDYHTEGYSRTAVMLGDSMLAQWFSLFATLYAPPEWRMVVLTKSACPMVDEDFFYERIGETYAVCSQWREAALEYLAEMRPDVIITGSGLNEAFSETQWIEGSRRVLEQLAAAAGQVILLPSTPKLTLHGPSCLLGALESAGADAPLPTLAPACSSDRSLPLAKRLRDYVAAAATQVEGVRLLDLTPLVCRDGVCSAVTRDGTVVYRDKQHLTDTFVRSLAPTVTTMLNDLASRERTID